MPTHAGTRLRTTVTAVVLTTVFAAAGCSGGPAPTPAGAGSASNSVSVSATPSAPAPSPTPTAIIGKPYIVKGTRAEFSSAQLKSAWKYATEFAARYSFNPALMNTTEAQVTKRLLQPIRAQIGDAKVLAEFDKDIATEARGQDNHGAVDALASAGMNVSGFQMATPTVTGLHIDGTMSVPTKDVRLATKLTQRAQLHYIDPDKKAVKSSASKTVTLYLEPKGTGWVITGYDWDVKYGNLTPDS